MYPRTIRLFLCRPLKCLNGFQQSYKRGLVTRESVGVASGSRYDKQSGCHWETAAIS